MDLQIKPILYQLVLTFHFKMDAALISFFSIHWFSK